MPYRSGEDLTGQEVTIRFEDGTEVQGHGFKWNGEDMTGEDTEGHVGRYTGIELEVDDTHANMLRAATDKGEPVYVRFPDGAEVKGHGIRYGGEDTTGEDTEGHGARYTG